MQDEKISEKSILGALWSEGMRNVDMLLSQVFPRMNVLARVQKNVHQIFLNPHTPVAQKIADQR